MGSFLEVASFVHHEHGIDRAEPVHDIPAQVVPHSIGIPFRLPQKVLQAVWRVVTGMLSQRPAVLHRQPRHQPGDRIPRQPPRLHPREPRRDPPSTHRTPPANDQGPCCGPRPRRDLLESTQPEIIERWPPRVRDRRTVRSRTTAVVLSFAVVTDSFDPVAYNRAAWDREVENSNEWTQPVGPEVIARARAGDWSVVLIGSQAVPRGWFPAELVGAEVLCLASGGGQQGPVLSAAGAAVTVLDNSPQQLGRDREVATREGLAVRTVLGDMRDLSVFPDASFDVVFNPVSNVFCPDLAPVWRESFRVLRPGGILMVGFLNPDIFIFDITALEERGELIVRHQLPFSSLDLPDAERQRSYGTGPIEYSHSLTGQIGGQLAAGFTLTHLDEAPHHADATARYMPGYFATRAIKP